MSKKIKNLIERELEHKFKDIEGCAVVSSRGLDGNKNNKLRQTLHGKGMKMLVVKNSLARRAASGSKIKGFESLLSGPSAVVFGSNVEVSAIARLLVDAKKDNDKLELRGVFFDGQAYSGEKGVEEISKLPTREEALGLLVGAMLAPGGKLAAALKGPGGKIGGILKAIEEKAGGDAASAPAADAPAEAAAAT